MKATFKAPKMYKQFVTRFPKLGEAWDLMSQAGSEGLIDERTARLVKLGISIGAMREGAVHSAVRKALSAGVSKQEIEQVVALAASTLGLPTAVAAWGFVRDVTEKR